MDSRLFTGECQMRIKQSYTEEQIALMSLETRINVQREIDENPDTKIKRQKRIKAINNPKKQFNLDERKMQARLELAQRAIAARDSKTIITTAQQINNGIYCCKTGAFIGRIDTLALTMAQDLDLPFDEAETIASTVPQWQTHHAIHPAWLNTSAPVLAQLQRIMPHEYVIYLYTYLIEHHAEACHSVIKTMAEIEENKWHEIKTFSITTIPAPYKYNLLMQLYNAPLVEVIEIAELLRILAALMGKSKAIITAMPQMQIKEFLFVGKYRSELLAFLRTALQLQQKKHHARDMARANLITSADLYEITSAYGIKLFGAARISHDDDNPVIGDVADLFHDADISPVTVAKYYSKVKAKEKKQGTEYSTKLSVSNAKQEEQTDGSLKLKPITL